MLSAGIGSLAAFFDVVLNPKYVTISFCSNLSAIKNIIQYDKYSFFSQFNCVIPGLFCLKFNDNTFKEINNMYSSFKQYNLSQAYFITSAIYELGSIFTGNSLTSLSEFINQNIIISKYGLDKNILEVCFFKENNQYMLCELHDNSKVEDSFISSYLVINVKYIKIIFEIFNLFI